jgi:hypothetical protein
LTFSQDIVGEACRQCSRKHTRAEETDHGAATDT